MDGLTNASKIFSLALAAAMLSGCATPGPTASGAASATPEARPASVVRVPAVDLEVVSAQFGIFGADGSGRRVLFETEAFPAVVSAPYGWYIIFKTNKDRVVWREEFELPEAPPTWGPGETMGVFTISPDRKTAVTERVIPTKVGFIANEWRYAPGDPIGAHAMRVYIDGQLVKEFKFKIEEGPGQKAPGARPKGSST
jgi:hypothetical protein